MEDLYTLSAAFVYCQIAVRTSASLMPMFMATVWISPSKPSPACCKFNTTAQIQDSFDQLSYRNLLNHSAAFLRGMLGWETQLRGIKSSRNFFDLAPLLL